MTTNNENIVRLYHGTSYNRYISIVKNGFASSKETIWNCSDGRKTYFYEKEKIKKYECIENEEEAINICLESANESAQITAAVEENPGPFTIVFEIVGSREILEEYIEDDDSCENMQETVCIDSDELNELVKTNKVKLYAYFFNFYPKLSLFYLIGLMNNQYFTETLDSLNRTEMGALKELYNNGIFIDDLYYTEEQIKLEEVYGGNWD